MSLSPRSQLLPFLPHQTPCTSLFSGKNEGRGRGSRGAKTWQGPRAAGEWAAWPEAAGEAAIKAWGTVGRQCPGETGLGKHVTLPTPGAWGWARALSLPKDPSMHGSLVIPGPQQLKSPEVFRSVCSFQGGPRFTCMNTVNTARRGLLLLSSPEHHGVFFPFSGNTSILYSFYTRGPSARCTPGSAG